MRSNSKFTACHALVCTLVLLAVPVPATAQFQTGDVVLGVVDPGIFPGFIDDSFLYVYTPDGALQQQILEQPPHQVRELGSVGTALYATDNSLCRLFPNGSRTCEQISALFSFQGITFDAQGNVYGAAQQGVSKFDPSLNHVATYSVVAGALDLAADQCTLSYPAGLTIQRYDICTLTPLTPLPTTLSDGIGRIRILSDGSMLVSTFPSVTENIFHLDAAGNTLRAYGSGRHLALDRDRTSFWTIRSGALTKIDIGTGAVVTAAPVTLPAQHGIVGLTVIGEPRAALFALSDMPTVSTWALLAVAASLALFGVLRLRIS